MVFQRLLDLRNVRLVHSVLFLVGSLFIGAAYAEQAESPDVRLVIDISGSMKKNDPENLRIPAVNMLTELVPEGSSAGVWTFGQWVNNLVTQKNLKN